MEINENAVGYLDSDEAKNRAGGTCIANIPPGKIIGEGANITPLAERTIQDVAESVKNPLVRPAIESGPIKYHRLTDSELMSLPTPNWIVKNLIPSTGVGQIYGHSGAGKTFLAIYLAACLSHGHSFYGYQIRHKVPITFIELEGISSYKDRIKALNYYIDSRNDWNKSEEDKFYHYISPFSLANEQESILFATSLEKGTVLFIDTQAMCTLGVDENDTGEMAKIIDTAKKMASTFEGFVFLIHHAGKNGRIEPRDSSVQYASMDVCIKIECKNGESTWTLDKLRDGEAGKKYNFKLKPIELDGLGDAGDPLTSCVAIPLEEYRNDMNTGIKTKTPETRNIYCSEIVKCIRNSNDKKVSKSEISSYLEAHIKDKMGKCPRREVSRYLNQLLNMNVIKEENGFFSMNN